MIGTVLIVDGVATNRIVMKVKLAAAGYRTLSAADAQSCLDLARRNQPDLILLDVDMPGIGGIDLLLALRADPQTARTLVVMFSANQNADLRLAALKAGADEFLTKPIDDQTLFARLRNLSRSQEEDAAGIDPEGEGITAIGMEELAANFTYPGLVAIVTTRPELAGQWRRCLSVASRDRFTCLSPDRVFQQQPAGGENPDVYLIEASLREADGGLKVMSALRSRHDTRHAKVCILNTEHAPAEAALAFDMGADDLVTATLSVDEIALRLNCLIRRKREADRLRAKVKNGLRLAMIDPLTGIPNRRFGLAQLASIADRSLAENLSFALMVLDIDRFKSVNDRFGHAAGDAVLIEVARRLTSCLRASDLIARIGGEEFLICLPNTALSESRIVAERLCQVIENTLVHLRTGEELNVTVSIGLALSHEAKGFAAAPLVSEIFDRADRALLAAKGAGRNQVTISRSAA
jgi:two-component system cell cycle response regulator